MIANLFVVKKSNKYGQNGLFATQFIPKGTFIDFRCKKCKVYTKTDLAKLTEKKRQFIVTHEVMTDENGTYTKFCDKRQLYDNHSCNANVLNAHILGHDTNGGIEIAIRDIKNGEEVTTDYRLNDGETVHFVGGCKCGAKNCMKNTTFKPPPTKKLQKFWSVKINSALRLVSTVDQPLKKQILREHQDLNYIFEYPKQVKVQLDTIKTIKSKRK